MKMGTHRRRNMVVAFVALWLATMGASQALAQYQDPRGSNDSRSQQRGDNQGDRSQTVPSDSDYSEPTLFSPRTLDGSSRDGSTLSSERLREAQLKLLRDRADDRGGNRSLYNEPPEPNEFQQYVKRATGRDLQRFGQDILITDRGDFERSANATVPPDYRLKVGDVISISLTGSVEGSVERQIDTNGNIFLPQVGTVHLAGVRNGDLRKVLANAIGTQFRNFRSGVRVRELTGIRVYVTGFANTPGAYTVSSLSTVANAVLQAGGPSEGGSFRSVKLIRDGAEVLDFDLYELLLGGLRVNDAVLEDEDVLFIPPVGRQVAVIGSVNKEAIYELRRDETLAEALQLAGGATELGEDNRLILYRVEPDVQPGPRPFSLSEARVASAQAADILQILPSGSLIQPTASQSVFVRLEGEVARPGNYYVPGGTPLSEVVRLAGGLTARAFPFGARFYRQSVAAQQQENFDEAIDQFELTLATAPLTVDSSIPLAQQQAQLAGAREYLEQLRQVEPDGRLVLDLAADAQVLPDTVALENGDRIVVPPVPSSVGVFGAVYRPASFALNQQSRRVKDYLSRAGGTVRAADTKNIFVVRASGEVLPRSNGALGERALPGDVIFVPIKTASRNFIDRLAQISSILFQFGLSAATVAAIK